MPREYAPKPPESVREWLIAKDGLLYWDQRKATDKRQAHAEPVRPLNQKRPTVNIEGRIYDLSRLNYWFHTGEWPPCVISKDHDKGNWHIDNLMPADAQQSNFHRQFTRRSYSIVERISKRGKRRYYAYITFSGKRKAVGGFKTEAEAINAAILMRKLLHGEYLSSDLK